MARKTGKVAQLAPAPSAPQQPEVAPGLATAVIIRVSRDRNKVLRKRAGGELRNDIVSPENQETICREWISRNGGGEVVLLPAAIDVSGSKISLWDREDIQKLITLAEQGRIQRVVAWEFSRYGRRPKECLDVITLLEQKRVLCYSATEPADPLTPDGQMLRMFYLGLAGHRAGKHAITMAQVKRRMRDQGRDLGGMPNYGCRWFNKSLIPDDPPGPWDNGPGAEPTIWWRLQWWDEFTEHCIPSLDLGELERLQHDLQAQKVHTVLGPYQGPILRWLYQLAAQHPRRIRQTVWEWLYENSIPTQLGRAVWDKSQIADLLRNPTPVQKGMISQDLYDQVVAGLTDGRPGYGGGRNNTDALLVGIMCCEHHHAMATQHIGRLPPMEKYTGGGQRKAVYVCRLASRFGQSRSGCPGPRLDAASLEQALVQYILRTAEDEEALQAKARAELKQANKGLPDLEKRLSALRQELSRVQKALVKAETERLMTEDRVRLNRLEQAAEQLASQERELEAKIERIEAELQARLNRAVDIRRYREGLATTRAEWDAMTPDQQRHTIRQLVREIRVVPEETRVIVEFMYFRLVLEPCEVRRNGWRFDLDPERTIELPLPEAAPQEAPPATEQEPGHQQMA